MRRITILLPLSFLAFSMGCGTLKQTGSDLIAEAKVAGKELGKELGQELLTKVKEDVLPKLAQTAQDATRNAIAQRVQDDPDLDTETKATILGLLGTSLGAGLLAWAKAKGKAKVEKVLGTVTNAVESSADAAGIKQAVMAKTAKSSIDGQIISQAKRSV